MRTLPQRVFQGKVRRTLETQRKESSEGKVGECFCECVHLVMTWRRRQCSRMFVASTNSLYEKKSTLGRHPLGACSEHELQVLERPVFECLLVSPGDGSIEYLFGVNSRGLGGFERVLQGLFPDSYELERITKPQTYPGRPWPGTTHETPLENTEANPEKRATEGSLSTQGLVGVVFEGMVGRSRDWQTSLQNFGSFQASEHARIPLSGVLEFLTSHDRPGVYQMLLRPKPDWSSEADARIRDLESHQDGLGAQLTSTRSLVVPRGYTIISE